MNIKTEYSPEDIIKILEEKHKLKSEEYSQELKGLLEAIDTIKKSYGIYNSNGQEKIRDYGMNPPLINPDYPVEGSLMDKIKFFDTLVNRVWKANEFAEKIMELEGVNTRTVRNLALKFKEYKLKKELVVIYFNGSNKKVFYTANQDWVQGEAPNEYVVKERRHPEITAMEEMSKIKSAEFEGRNI